MAKRRISHAQASDVQQLCLFPGDVAILPGRVAGGPARPSCAETGHSWAHGQQMRLFGLPPTEIVYCTICGKLYR